MSHNTKTQDYGKFDYSQVLFVSPNGDANKALRGRIDAPFPTIYDAIQNLNVDGGDGVTIWVLPGSYTEDNQLEFDGTLFNNITVKLEAGVAIDTNIDSDYLITLSNEMNISMIGDSPATFDNSGCKITDQGGTCYGALIKDTSIFNMENVALTMGKHNFSFNDFSGQFHINNCVIIGEINLFDSTGISSPGSISIRNSFLSTADTGSENPNIYSDIQQSNHLLHISNSRLHIDGSVAGSTSGHIRINTGTTGSAHLTMSDVILYSNCSTEEIFYDAGTVTSLIDVISPIVSNAGSYGLLSEGGTATNTTSGTVSFGNSSMEDISVYGR